MQNQNFGKFYGSSPLGLFDIKPFGINMETPYQDA